MGRLSLAISVVALLISSFAQAQPMGGGRPGGASGMGNPTGMGTPMGRGGGGVSPMMMTCRGDLASLCGGQMGMPGVQCLMDNITDLSEPCADALSTAMESMQEGHGADDGDDDDN